MYDFKNSFSSAFLHIHRAKYSFSGDMFCLSHFWAKIHGVKDQLKQVSQELEGTKSLLQAVARETGVNFIDEGKNDEN